MRTRSSNGLDQHQREFVKIIQKISNRHHLHKVFADFCEAAALSISNAVDRSQYEKREAQYMQIVKRYEADEIRRFPELLACLVMSLENGMSDCLGQLFMSMELGSHWQGQYFTPYEIAKMMASMTFGTISMSDIEQRGNIITVSEPASGAGGMVIAAAHVLKESGINYQQHLHVTAQDIESTAVHMCYLQLGLLHIPAVVIQGNTLANEVREHWVTPAHVLGGWDTKLKHHHADQSTEDEPMPNLETAVDDSLTITRSNIIQRRVETAEQINLF